MLPVLVALTSIVVDGAQSPTPRSAVEASPYATWTAYGGSSDSMQYSSLSEIDRTNVGTLELAWFFPVPDRTGDFGFNPIVIDEVMYVLGPANAIVALDAKAGTPIWSCPVEGGSPGQSRPRLLGEPRPLGSSPDLRRRRRAAADRRADRQADPHLR